MDRPTTHPFRDAALRTDAHDLQARDTSTASATTARASDARMVSDTGVVANAEPPVERRRFSLGATFLGWAVASFFTIVLVAVIAAVLGTTAATGGDIVDNGNVEEFAVGGIIAYLVATFVAYLIGGYAAGRIALWDGVKHGLLIVAWAIFFAIVGVLAASYLDTGFFTDANVPFDMANVTTGGIIAAILTLVAMLGGAAWGGAIGERYHDRVHGLAPRRSFRTKPRTGLRGRPL